MGFMSSNCRCSQCRCLSPNWLAVDLCDRLWRCVNAARGVRNEV